MKRSILRSITPIALLLLAAVALVVSVPQHAKANNAAVVFNQLACTITTLDGNEYDGTGSAVGTSSGNINFNCSAQLTSGTPVSATTHSVLPSSVGVICKVTETPSGNANATCH